MGEITTRRTKRDGETDDPIVLGTSEVREDGPSISSNAFHNILATGLTSVSSLVVTAFAGRVLGATLFGKAQFLLWLVAIVWLFVNFGLPTTLTRYVAIFVARREPQLVRHLARLAGSVVLVALPVGALVVLWFSSGVDSIGRTEAVVLFALMGLQSVLQAMTAGYRMYSRILKAAAGAALVSLVSFYPAITRYSIHGFLLTYILSSLSYSLVLLFAWDRVGGNRRGEPVRHWQLPDVLRFSFYTWLAAVISSFVWHRSEIFFINLYLKPADVAFFSISMTIVNMVGLPATLIGAVLLPYFSGKLSGGTGFEAERAYKFLTKLIAWAVFFLFFYLGANMRFVLPAIYGKLYGPAIPVAAVIMVGSTFGVIASPGSSLVYAHGKSKFIAVTGVVGAAFAIIGGVSMVPAFGTIGAALSKVIIQVIMVVVGTIYIVRYLRFAFPFASYFKSLIVAALVASLSFAFGSYRGFIPFLAGLIATAVLYVVGTRMLGVFDAGELGAIKSLLKSPLKTVGL